MNINYNDFNKALTALNIPALSMESKQTLFYDDLYIKFRAGVTFSKVNSRKKDLEILLDSPVELTTGNGCIIIRVLKSERTTESLYNYLGIIPDLQKNHDYILPLAIGQDENGKRIFFDLVKAPHILTGGSTGSGKSVFLNNCILSLIYGAKSALCMIDVKKVEFSIYEDIPNLASPIAYTTKDAKKLLKNLCYTMESRYDTLKKHSCRNIQEYNEKTGDDMQYITLFIDEIADLFMQDKTIEPLVVRLVQLGRAGGIHLIIATQRPDSTIVSGLIRANIPTRVCFAVQKATDSRIILDESGGEHLKGAGDGLLKPIGSRNVTRFQAPYINTNQMITIVNRLKHL